MNTFMRFVDGLNTWIGRTVGWVMVFIMFVTVYDIIGRRLFNSPVPWAFDVSTQLFGLHFMIVAAYTLLHDEHVSINIFKDRLSRKNRARLDILSYIIFFFPFMILLLVYGWEFAARSWATRETSWGATALPVYYIKSVIPATAILLMLQGVCRVIRMARVARGGETA
mgnify:CR=1 FL=1